MTLPLVPDQPFSEGDEWSPSLAYLALKAPIFDDQPSYLGHRAKLLDSELSDSSGQIKDRLAIIEGGFKVTVGSNLTLNYASGSVVLPDGSVTSVAAGSVTAPSSSTAYVFLTDAGAVQVSTIVPGIRRLLAKVVTGVSTVTSLQDLRNPGFQQVLPVANSIKVFGGLSSSDKTCTQGEVLGQGLYYFRNFVVPAGVTITIDKFAKIYCSGYADIQGTIVVNQLAAGAQSTAYTLTNNGAVGGLPGSGIGANFTTYPLGAQPYGSGGSLGVANTPSASAWGAFGKAGDGGGCLWLEVNGSLSVSGTITANGSDGQQGRTSQTSNTPGAITTGVYAVIGGGGGGSGGLVYLASRVSVAVTGTINAKGGSGGSGLVYVASGTYGAIGGLPGAGGIVSILAPNVNTSTATINLGNGNFGAFVGFTQINSTTYQITSPNGIMGGGMGGSFGAVPPTVSTAVAGNVYTLTLSANTTGQLLISNNVPVA